jgi:hypothetical protein
VPFLAPPATPSRDDLTRFVGQFRADSPESVQILVKALYGFLMR